MTPKAVNETNGASRQQHTAPSLRAPSAARFTPGPALLTPLLAGLLTAVFAFSAAPALAAEACPNQELRQQQHSTALPDCRAYEMVSPVYKNGGDVSGDTPSITASAAGDAVAYLARGSFGDTTGSGAIGQTQYVARREISGWTNRSITPMPSYDATEVWTTTTSIMGFSDDLRSAVVWGYDLPEVAGALPKTANIYAEDTTTRGLQLVTTPAALVDPLSWFPFDFVLNTPGGVSHDSRHIAFRALTPLLPQAPPGVRSVYEWDNGILRLASILPDGNPASAGAALAPAEYRESVSPDGSRVTFVSPPEDPSGQLYMRVDHDRTVWVSQPETTGPPPTPQDVVLQQVTGDSRHVIFATSSRLLPGDTNDGSDLYLYTESADPASDANLTLVTDTGDVPGLDINGHTAVVGSSNDASRIYYIKNRSIFLKEGSTTRVVAEKVGELRHDSYFDFSATSFQPGGARVSPDGRYLALYAPGNPARNGVPVATAEGHAEMYLYDAVTDTLRCVSCPARGSATSDASIVPSVDNNFPSLESRGLRPSYLADDGRTFFSTAEALVPQDVNGVTDAYEFDPATGEVVLLSTGKGSEPASFAAASASGNDAFIVTRQQLVKADRDTLIDVYDVRVGGGFPEQQEPVPPCEGDGCQGPLSAPPEASAVGSSGFSGVGNFGEGARSTIGGLRKLSASDRSTLAKGGKALLRLTVSGSGTVTVAGTAKVANKTRRVVSASAQANEAGAVSIPLALSRSALSELSRKRSLIVRLTVRFKDARPEVVSITLRSAASKKGGRS